jgi:hypothetical protein
MKLTKKEANDVYDILVNPGGASEHMREAFVDAHIHEDKFFGDCCDEWRFQGYLGFGGKYRSKTNKVDCYSEDENPKRIELVKEINKKLSEVRHDRGDQS